MSGTKTRIEDSIEQALKNIRKKELNHVLKILKSESQLKKGLVFGIVYEPNVLDSHGDYTDASEIEKAAHNFLPNAMINLNHEDNSPDIEVVESYIARCDFSLDGSDEVIKEGSWVLVTRVNDEELKKSIENGEFTGYSLEGYATYPR